MALSAQYSEDPPLGGGGTCELMSIKYLVKGFNPRATIRIAYCGDTDALARGKFESDVNLPHAKNMWVSTSLWAFFARTPSKRTKPTQQTAN